MAGIVLIVLFGSACVYSPSPPRASASQWPTYTDSSFRFTISYPPNFTFQHENGSPGTGLLDGWRAVDPVYLNRSPLGQVEITVYTRDATSIDTWISKHTGPAGSPEMTRYWSPVTKQSKLTVGDRSAVSFDWVPDTGRPTIHTTAIFLGATFVLTVAWWSYDSTYGTSLQRYHQQMLSENALSPQGRGRGRG
jgi:hypothetical protein